MISTTVFLHRAGYSWFAAALAGFFSPLAFIVLYAFLGLSLSLIIGKLHISEQELPQSVVAPFSAAVVVLAWCVGGFFLTRTGESKRPPHLSH